MKTQGSGKTLETFQHISPQKQSPRKSEFARLIKKEIVLALFAAIAWLFAYILMGFAILSCGLADSECKGITLLYYFMIFGIPLLYISSIFFVIIKFRGKINKKNRLLAFLIPLVLILCFYTYKGWNYWQLRQMKENSI